MTDAELCERLQQAGYICDEALATTLWLAGELERPLLLEGDAGVDYSGGPLPAPFGGRGRPRLGARLFVRANTRRLLRPRAVRGVRRGRRLQRVRQEHVLRLQRQGREGGGSRWGRGCVVCAARRVGRHHARARRAHARRGQ